MSGMYRKQMNLLGMTIEGNQWPFTLWLGRFWFPTCAGHCLGIKGLGGGAIAVEVIVICRRVFVHVRLVASHGDDVLFGVQRLPSFLEQRLECGTQIERTNGENTRKRTRFWSSRCNPNVRSFQSKYLGGWVGW